MITLSAAAATGIGSMPGTDAVDAARTVLGELPQLPHIAELPARGVGADILGRTAGMLIDLPVEVMPSGYRVTARPGSDQRAAIDMMRRDLDALQDAVDRAGGRPMAVKVQVAGPWTLAAGIELASGHRVLTDSGALREFTQSLIEGLSAHAAEVGKRTGLPVVAQLDEPNLPAVLAGSLPTPSGFGTVAAVPAADARERLSTVVEGARDATGNAVIVHCCARRPPISLLHATGADALAIDVTTADGAPSVLLDELGQAWDSGVTVLLGLVPTTEPGPENGEPDLRSLAAPALNLVDRLGFARRVLAERAVVTPACGLAGAGTRWMRTALALARDLGNAFTDPPEGW